MEFGTIAAISLFCGYIHDLAANLLGLERAQRCALCAYTASCDGTTVIPPCCEGIEKKLLESSAGFLADLDACCQNYFSCLEELSQKGGYDLYTAEEALQEEFPYLSSHPAHTKFVMAAWLLTHDELKGETDKFSDRRFPQQKDEGGTICQTV